ncbi:MAG: Zn-ribbon domain-containing OB-fold protein [Candidatus Bathyarchaeia archaeon]
MKKEAENVVITSKIVLPFSYAAGRTASRFFTELRDNQRIMGKRCPKCNRVIVPPRKICGKCFAETSEWVEVSNKGTLITYTTVYKKMPHLPKGRTLTYGIIRLDEADTNIVHFLREVDPKKIKPRMRVQAVFKEKREGNILDIDYFKPI